MMFDPDKLTIETPEQTSLEFPLAGVGSRFLALAADTAIQLVTMFVLLFVVTLLVPWLRFLGSITEQWILALGLIVVFLLYSGYFVFFEAVWNGQTPGKRYAKLRVINETGQPISAYEAVVRNLMRIVDSLPGVYAVGIVSILFSKQNKRLGDFVAGTVVVHERPIEGFRPVWEAAANTVAPASELARISLEEFQLLETFLNRRTSLAEDVRRQMARQIAERVGKTLGTAAEYRGDPERFLEEVAQARRALARYR